MDLQQLLASAIRASEIACERILEVYHSNDFATETKGDASPLTKADRLAHQAIVSRLQDSGIPVLSEEGKSIPYEVRSKWNYLWIVDPLDGTKEFIKRNDEFTVNIALIQKQVPILGVVAVPVTGKIYYALRGSGAFMEEGGVKRALKPVLPIDLKTAGIRVVASRSHMDEETQAFVRSLKDPVLVSKGSSLKFMLLAEGEADVYPRFAPTMEWDTAAAHAIANEVGLSILQKNSSKPLVYNKPDLLNPFFFCSASSNR